MYRTLTLLGLEPDLISVHLLSKGNNVHGESERKAMLTYQPERVIVLDQGSRRGPRIVDSDACCLVLDHHFAAEGECPDGAVVSFLLFSFPLLV
jgi:single-stranded DNA-specific DHH superfamily exonuclease